MKQWVLLPPNVHYGPNDLPMAEWLNKWRPSFATDVLECTQFTGDVLYVPSNYMHSVRNLQTSIGVAVEIGHNTQLFERLLSHASHSLQTRV